MKTSKTIVGVLAGVAVGAALGVLFAPDKGTNTRKKIAKKSSKLKDNAMESFGNLVTSMENKYAELASKTSEEIENGKSTVELINDKLKR